MPEDTRHRRLIYFTGSLNADQANASRIAHSADAMIPKMIGILITRDATRCGRLSLLPTRARSA